MHLTLVNMLGVAVIAFFVPFILGFFPRVRIPAVALELVAGIVIGPAVLAAALVLAGLVSAIALPAVATTLLGGAKQDAVASDSVGAHAGH
jgi:hypothetical protein